MTRDVEQRLKALGSKREPLRLVAVWNIKEWPQSEGIHWSRWRVEADLHARLQRWALGHEWFAPGAASVVRRLRGRSYPFVRRLPRMAYWFNRGEFRLWLDAYHANGRSQRAAEEAVRSMQRCQKMRAQISALKTQNRKLREQTIRVVEAA